jgi:DNA-binding LacI/PurR family transcriptional regulator
MTDALKAVLYGNDILAFGAMAAVRNAGYIVGVDVSITGFDDLVISRVTDPPLATVHVPGYKMCGVGANVQIDLIQGEIDEPQQ